MRLSRALSSDQQGLRSLALCFILLTTYSMILFFLFSNVVVDIICGAVVSKEMMGVWQVYIAAAESFALTTHGKLSNPFDPFQPPKSRLGPSSVVPRFSKLELKRNCGLRNLA